MQEFLNQDVVVDVEAMFVYLGRLEAVNEKSLTLSNADVHDLRDSNKARERYVLDAKLHGIRANRKLVHVSRGQVLSISLLNDVLE